MFDKQEWVKSYTFKPARGERAPSAENCKPGDEFSIPYKSRELDCVLSYPGSELEFELRGKYTMGGYEPSPPKLPAYFPLSGQPETDSWNEIVDGNPAVIRPQIMALVFIFMAVHEFSDGSQVSWYIDPVQDALGKSYSNPGYLDPIPGDIWAFHLKVPAELGTTRIDIWTSVNDPGDLTDNREDPDDRPRLVIIK